MVGFRGLTIGPDDPITKALQDGLGGVILFDQDPVTGTRNIESPAQLAALVAALRDAAAVSLIVAIDQEGGRVSRLNPARGFPATRSQDEVGASDDPDAAFEAGRSMAETMAAAGIDRDLAPGSTSTSTRPTRSGRSAELPPIGRVAGRRPRSMGSDSGSAP
jgi:beta-N-acetylhexosaminidase